MIIIPSDGYIVLPISMSRSNNSQGADVCYDILLDLQQQCEDPSTIDVVVLYTTCIYYNNQDESAWKVKKRLTTQMLSHKAALATIIRRRGELHFSVQFLSWEEMLLAAPDYQKYYQRLQQHIVRDQAFHDLAVFSIGNRKVTDAGISFLVEETVVVHLLRQKQIALPKHAVHDDNFRLVVYPGPYIAIDLYQWKRRILPQNTSIPFGGSQYNGSQKELYTFDDMTLPVGTEWLRELRIEKGIDHSTKQ